MFQWIDVLAQTDNYFVGLKKNSHIKINSIEEAKQYRVAVLRDDLTHKLLIKHGFTEKKNLYIVNNTHSLLKLLVARKNIDLVLVDKLAIKYRAKLNDIDPALLKIFFGLSESPVPLYLACNVNTDPNIIKQLTKAMATIKANGQYQAIENKWSIEN
jgi:polar amino acid transport system substrate-binding protein